MTQIAESRPATDGPAPTSTSTDSLTAQVQTYLDTLGYQFDDHVSINHQTAARDGNPRGKFTSTVVPATVDAITAAVQAAGDACVWIGVNPVNLPTGSGARGGAETVTKQVALYAELDDKNTSWQQMTAVIADLSARFGPPAMTIASGHGLHLYWPLMATPITSATDRAQAIDVIARFGEVVFAVARIHGAAKPDQIYDLSRILRVPGTFNLKESDKPVSVRITNIKDTTPLFIDAAETLIDRAEKDLRIGQYAPQKTAPAATPRGSTYDGDSVADQYSRETSWAEILKPHGWTLVRGDGDSQESRWRRPGAESDTSASVLHDQAPTPVLRVFSSEAAPLEAGKTYTRFRAYATLDHGGDLSAAAKCLRGIHGDDYGNTTFEVTQQERDEFFDARPELRHIRAFAYARAGAPYPTLVGVLRRILAATEPNIVLPPTIGTYGSLNLFTTTYGMSGVGKDSANGIAEDAVRIEDCHNNEVHTQHGHAGSGEGLARLFTGHGKNGDGATTRRHVVIPEIRTLEALAGRTGATLEGELLKAFMGQGLGMNNATQESSSVVAAHSYRLCLGVGTQPDHSDVLLSRSGSGLPQRFLWVQATDPSIPDDGGKATDYRIVLPEFTLNNGAWHVVDVPDAITREIRRQHLRRVRGETGVNPDDGHLMFVRLKVATGLAFMNSRVNVNDEDWELAGHLIWNSNSVRAAAYRHNAKAVRAGTEARAERQAHARQIMANHARAYAAGEAAEWILSELSGADDDGWVSGRWLQRNANKRFRDEVRETLKILAERGLIEKQRVGRAIEYRIPPTKE